MRGHLAKQYIAAQLCLKSLLCTMRILTVANKDLVTKPRYYLKGTITRSTETHYHVRKSARSLVEQVQKMHL